MSTYPPGAWCTKTIINDKDVQEHATVYRMIRNVFGQVICICVMIPAFDLEVRGRFWAARKLLDARAQLKAMVDAEKLSPPPTGVKQ